MPQPPAKLAAQLNLNEEADEATAQEVAQIFGLLLKGIKNINIYRHAQARFVEYITPAFDALNAFLDREGLLPLKLSPFALEFKKRVIYDEQDKESLAYKFYKDGVRFLMFRQGLPINELLEFVLLATEALTDAALAQEDMVTRLWKKNFQSIEYIVVETFAFADLSPEDVELEVDKIIAYLRKQLAAKSNDITRFARLDIEDLELELSDIEQVRGGIISGRPAKDDDKQSIQANIFDEEKRRLFAKMVLILFQILERDAEPSEYEMLISAFGQVLDSLLLQEDIRGSVAVLERLDRITARSDLEPSRIELAQRIRVTFLEEMSQPERLRSIGQYLALNKQIDEVAVRAYFSCMPVERLPGLIEMLVETERVEARQILIDVLAVLGKDHLQLFVDRIGSSASTVVRDMLAIVDRINPSFKLDIYAKTLDHPNIVIRMEGFKFISQAPGERAIRYIETALRDDDMQLRIIAYRALAKRSAERAAIALKARVLSDEFLTLDRREQVAIVVALAETKRADVIEFFRDVFSAKGSLFSRGKQNELKLLAIKGLSSMRTVEAFNALALQVQNRTNSKEIMEAAHKAAVELKTKLETPGRVRGEDA